MTGGAASSANSYWYTGTQRDASHAVRRNRQLFRPPPGMKSDMAVPSAVGTDE